MGNKNCIKYLHRKKYARSVEAITDFKWLRYQADFFKPVFKKKKKISTTLKKE